MMRPDAITRALMNDDPKILNELAELYKSGGAFAESRDHGAEEQRDAESGGRETGGQSESQKSSPWPAPIDRAAFHGLPGEMVRVIEPQSEADPVAILIHILVAVGSIWGRSPFFRVGATKHYTNENAICVGKTSSARKGTAKSDSFFLLRQADTGWADENVKSGLSTGEGLISAVRDETLKEEPLRGKNKVITGYQTVVSDRGVSDKRLLVIEPEFASVLRTAGRDGNTLSAVYREAWDGGHLRVMNKNSPVKATGAHISIIGHITREELLMELSHNDKVNGFGNRNLWLLVKRSKYLPDGGAWDGLDLDPLIARLKTAVEFARKVHEMRRDDDARTMWHSVYPQLSAERDGVFGAMTTRAEAHVVRLSCIYALLDCSAVVRACHLEAALAVWKYCEDCAAIIFGDVLGNPVVDQIIKALVESGADGMRRNDLGNLFSRHRSSDEVNAALSILQQRGLVRREKQESGGRPVERWFATSEAKVSR